MEQKFGDVHLAYSRLYRISFLTFFLEVGNLKECLNVFCIVLYWWLNDTIMELADTENDLHDWSKAYTRFL